MNDNVTIVLVCGMLFGIPLLGLTARMVLKPMVEALVKLREAGALPQNGPVQISKEAEVRIQQLEQEVTMLRGGMQRLTEAEAFTRALYAGSAQTRE